MHDSSYKAMAYYARTLPMDKHLRVCDVGSYNVNGNYKELFQGHDYTGLDLTAGPNVDVVSVSEYDFGLPSEYFDVVVSGQTIEHVRDTQRWIKEVARIAKVGGEIVVIGPMAWTEHRYPIDCWRILPDGMKFLLEDIAGLKVVEITKTRHDCVGRAKKI